VFRILVAVGWVRVLFLSGKAPRIRLTEVDKAQILWAISSLVSFTILYSSTDALINRLGFCYNALGMYFLFRVLINEVNEVDRGASGHDCNRDHDLYLRLKHSFDGGSGGNSGSVLLAIPERSGNFPMGGFRGLGWAAHGDESAGVGSDRASRYRGRIVELPQI